MIGLGLSVGLKLLSFRSQRKQRKKQKAANEIERKRRQVANVVARRQAAAAIRRQAAQSAALTSAYGVSGSAASNTQSNINAQGDAQNSLQTQLGTADINRFDLQVGANSRANQAESFGAAANLLQTHSDKVDNIVDKGISFAQGG